MLKYLFFFQVASLLKAEVRRRGRIDTTPVKRLVL